MLIVPRGVYDAAVPDADGIDYGCSGGGIAQVAVHVGSVPVARGRIEPQRPGS